MPKAEIKFTEEELSKINEFQQRYLNIQSSFGQASISQIRLDKQLDMLKELDKNLKDQFTAVQREEQEFIEEINKKYGDGVLDPVNNIFTPSTPSNLEE